MARTLLRQRVTAGQRLVRAASDILLGWTHVTQSMDQALARFAETYADQNERDHQALLDAVKSGRVQAAATTA